MAAFARMVGLKYQTFARWVWLRREARRSQVQQASASDGSTPVQSAATGLRWLEAVVAQPATAAASPPAARNADAAGLRVELPGGGMMQIDSCAQVLLAAELLRVLEASQRSRASC